MKTMQKISSLLSGIILAGSIGGCQSTEQAVQSPKETIDLSSLNQPEYTQVRSILDYDNYSELTQEERNKETDNLLQKMEIKHWIDTPQGPLYRSYEVIHDTPLDELLVITPENFREYPVWDRDVILEGEIKYRNNEPLKILPGVNVYFGYHELTKPDEDPNGNTASIEIFTDLIAQGTLDNRIVFTPITDHPEGQVYLSDKGAPDYEMGTTKDNGGLFVPFSISEPDSYDVLIEYAYFSGMHHGGVAVVNESDKPLDMTIRYNIFRSRFGIYSVIDNSSLDSKVLIESNFFCDPITTTETLDFKGNPEGTVKIKGNIIGPVEGIQGSRINYCSGITLVDGSVNVEENLFVFSGIGVLGGKLFEENNSLIGEPYFFDVKPPWAEKAVKNDFQ